MYGFGGNARKPKRPQDMLDRTQTVDGFQQPSAPAPRVVTPMAPPEARVPSIDRPNYITTGADIGSPQQAPLPTFDDSSMSEVGVPIPSLSGPNRPQRYDPVEFARYDYQTRDRKPVRPYTQLNPETGQEEFVNKEAMYAPQRTKRSVWDVLKTAGVGALQGMASGGGLGGAIGGALAGGIGGAISPEAGRGYQFDVLQRPRMEADIQRGMAYDKFGREQRLGEIDLRKRQAEAEQTEAETRYLPARYGQEGALRQSQIEANKARAASLSRPERPRYSPEEEQRRTERHQMEMKRLDAQTKRALRPPSSGGGRGGGGAEQPTPAALNTMHSRVVQAKQEAEEAWAIANADADPQARAIAEAALRAYNSLAEQLGRAYPQMFEVGPGQGGWNYIKERGR